MRRDRRDTRRIVDLSHTIEHGMITYRGLPAPLICDFLSREQSREHYAPGTTFQIGKIEMIANTGTYLDSPFHRYADGDDVASLPLSRLVDCECVVVRVAGATTIQEDSFADLDIEQKAVLFHTGWDTRWRTDSYCEGHPHLSLSAAQALADRGALIAGIDSFNIDSTADGTRPVHTVLLARGIPIVEHLRNLGLVPETGARFSSPPLGVRGMGTFPVRAFAIVPSAATDG